eukprot:COSAG01_NODE_22624_length_848_cov_0.835781_1_plen_66_part_10
MADLATRDPAVIDARADPHSECLMRLAGNVSDAAPQTWTMPRLCTPTYYCAQLSGGSDANGFVAVD